MYKKNRYETPEYIKKLKEKYQDEDIEKNAKEFYIYEKDGDGDYTKLLSNRYETHLIAEERFLGSTEQVTLAVNKEDIIKIRDFLNKLIEGEVHDMANKDLGLCFFCINAGKLCEDCIGDYKEFEFCWGNENLKER
jgi:hypothetical protein